MKTLFIKPLSMKPLIFFLAFVFAVTLPAVSNFAAANVAVPVGEDQLIEARLRALGEDLRCMVCQNESIISSNAKLAVDLRQKVRDLMNDGKDDAQIIEFLTARYGDFVLYRPPFRSYTLLLWLGPGFFIALGAMAWYFALRRRSSHQICQQVSAAELKQAASLLGNSVLDNPTNPNNLK